MAIWLGMDAPGRRGRRRVGGVVEEILNFTHTIGHGYEALATSFSIASAHEEVMVSILLPLRLIFPPEVTVGYAFSVLTAAKLHRVHT